MKTLTTIVLIFLSSVAFSQSIGIQAGLNYSTLFNQQADVTPLPGFTVGIQSDSDVNERVTFGTALLINYNRIKDNLIDEPINITTFSVPMQVGLKIANFKAFAGPEFTYLISAKIDGERLTAGVEKANLIGFTGVSYMFGGIDLGVKAQYGVNEMITGSHFGNISPYLVLTF